ncbi:hypothetical protein SARC_14312 [Sphaeroforma arctica JP610]|uniref:Uncharacterized protein n=1 Tax=Sphaeroforma arctica JP610 TaxID=667725 RepID=A0A0L0F8U5_9EUKA|nr:hypothetical protein SARC_14312 [Sphaeroforma arctica JP610]KNC73130.1 hypothetical protein SARC_14312 [Sphaeroforma arctica JP610]|eukprot:XP_014147032.1 hypothetical protein SARC_14312 [Sphaeroforma arctica JP610]
MYLIAILRPYHRKVWKSGQEGDRLKLADRKNELLVQYFEKCDKKGKIREGPSLCDYKFNNDRELYTNDGVHFSSKGYKLLAALTLEAINTVLTKVEFDSVRNELYGRHETERRDSLLGGVRAESKEEAKVLDLDSNSDADSDTELHTSKDK